MSPEESEVLDRIRAGDPRAFEKLFRDHYPELVRFARASLGDEAEAEDAVHDVFLRIWRNRADLEVERSFRVFLFAATRNRTIDIRRHRGVAARHIEPERAWGDRAGDGDAVTEPAAAAPDIDPERLLELAELDAAIRQAIHDLPERGRTAFVLCREQEMTYAEAAAVMGVSPATVKTHVARALAAIRLAARPFLLALLVALSRIVR